MKNVLAISDALFGTGNFILGLEQPSMGTLDALFGGHDGIHENGNADM